MSLLGEEWTSAGLQATVLGAANSASQIGSATAMLVWSGVITACGLQRAFAAAALLFAAAATPLLPACACGLLRRVRTAPPRRWRRRRAGPCAGGTLIRPGAVRSDAGSELFSPSAQWSTRT